MQFCYNRISDVGIQRKVNQDAVISLEAETEFGPVFMAAVCDGMGGLADGEVAAQTMARELEDWFREDLPDVVYDERGKHTFGQLLNASLMDAILRADHRIYKYSQGKGIKCGTTAVILVLFRDHYYTANIGDSRAYLFRKRLFQLTKDQTLTQQRLDRGEISEEMAEIDKDRSVLLQCVGMNTEIIPEYSAGDCGENDIFLLCSDGFRHKITAGEMEKAFRDDDPKTKIQIKELLYYLVEENKKRHETDNISALIVRVMA